MKNPIPIKTIENNKEYQKVLKLVEGLINKDPNPNTPDGEKLEQLVTIVQNYEKSTFCDDYKCTLWENIWWPIEGWLEKTFIDKPRKIKCFFQRGKRGYSDCDIWSLDDYLLSWLPKAIRDLRNYRNSYPSNLTHKKWQKTLTRMAKGLGSGERFINSFNQDEKKIKKWKKEFDEGMKLFHKHFFSLWD